MGITSITLTGAFPTFDSRFTIDYSYSLFTIFIFNTFNMPLFTDLPVKEIAPGLNGYYAHGASSTLGFVDIKAGAN